MLKVIIFRFIVKLMPFFMWRKKSIPQNLNIENSTVLDVPVRIYTPEGKGPFPVTLYIHGGGWVVGSLDSCDALCRDYCIKTEHVVISVDYPLAPENPFPAAPNACMKVFNWLANNAESLNADENKIYVAGDSAGGNLATVTALQATKSHAGVIKGQILIFPVTDHYSTVTKSYLDNIKTQSLNKGTMEWFWDNYLKDTGEVKSGTVNNALLTPLKVDDLSALPPAIVLMADKDPLRDEGIAYANKMAKQGVEVQQNTYMEVEHGFIGYMGPTDEHNKAMQEIVDWLAKY